MMKRLRLKIVGCVVVVLVTAIAVYVFRPAKATEVAESKDSEQVQKPAEHKLATEAKLPRPRPERAAGLYQSKAPQTTEFKELNPAQRSLYRDTSFGDRGGGDVRSTTPRKPKFIKSRRLRRRLPERRDTRLELVEEEPNSADGKH